MKNICKLIVLAVLALALSSCNAFAPKPTETATPTVTATATITPTATSTRRPTAIPTGTPVPMIENITESDFPEPTDKPLKEWEGVPVMPGAMAGGNLGDEIGGKNYIFTVKASTDEVQNYYADVMTKLNWQMMGTGESTQDTRMLIYLKDPVIMILSIIPKADGTTLVWFFINS